MIKRKDEAEEDEEKGKKQRELFKTRRRKTRGEGKRKKELSGSRNGSIKMALAIEGLNERKETGRDKQKQSTKDHKITKGNMK